MATDKKPLPTLPDVKAKLLEGKKGLVVGIANDQSIAWGCARAFRAFGAEVAVTYLNDKARRFVEPLAKVLEAPIFMPLDVQKPGEMEAVFDRIGNVHWTYQLATFLVPTVAYGALMLGRRFPKSEASASGVEIGTMLLQFASPVLLFLLLLHACVGYVELGTDSWIGNITGRILESKESGLWLFIWTSGLMFVLRFFAGPIVHKINPLGLLFASAIFGTVGLLLEWMLMALAKQFTFDGD